MDSLSQLALGAAVGVAAMGRRTAVWKAALWGGIAGTLPDLDVAIDYGDPVRNMTFHRAESHALFYLSLFSPLLAWVAWRIHGRAADFRRWWLAMWLALITHPLLDAFTVYGTQLMLPFTDHPYAIGSMFIIDPLYTVPLLIGVAAALVRRQHAGLRSNAIGLMVSSAYLLWSVGAQAHVRHIAHDSLRANGLAAEALLITPTPFNTLLWRVVAMDASGYREGFYSLFDASPTVDFQRFDSAVELWPRLEGNWAANRLAWFSRGYYKVSQPGEHIVISDLRMGQEPHYVFAFVVAEADGGAITPRVVGSRGDTRELLRWTWRRIWE